MNQAIGLIEVVGLASAIKTADTMLKAANVTFKTMEKAKGSGWMTIVVEGDVGAVNASVNSGEADAKQYGTFVSSKVIARPANGLSNAFEAKPVEVKEEEPAAKKEEPAKAEAKKPAPKAASTPKETPAKAQAEKAKPVKSANTKQPAKAQDNTTHTKEAEKQSKAN